MQLLRYPSINILFFSYQTCSGIGKFLPFSMISYVGQTRISTVNYCSIAFQSARQSTIRRPLEGNSLLILNQIDNILIKPHDVSGPVVCFIGSLALRYSDVTTPSEEAPMLKPSFGKTARVSECTLP